MHIRFENKAEAFATIATVVASVDKMGTREERKFLFENVKEFDVFKDYSTDEFNDLLKIVTDKVNQALFTKDYNIAEKGIRVLCEAVKEVLEPELRVSAFRMAVQLACVDRLVKVEKELLYRIQEGLEIDKEMADEIISTTLLPHALR